MTPLWGYLAHSVLLAEFLSQASVCCPVPLSGLTCVNRQLQGSEIIGYYLPLLPKWCQTPCILKNIRAILEYPSRVGSRKDRSIAVKL